MRGFLAWLLLVVAACQDQNHPHDPVVVLDAAPPPMSYRLVLDREDADAPAGELLTPYIDGAPRRTLDLVYPSWADAMGSMHLAELRYRELVCIAGTCHAVPAGRRVHVQRGSRISARDPHLPVTCAASRENA